MDSFIAWVGGKKSCRDFILPRFPLEYKMYVEVFAGAAWIYFAEERKGVDEYINDVNSDLANLYWCAQNKKDELIERLYFSVNSRELFNYVKKEIKLNKAVLGDITRAAYFYEVIRYSFANNCKTYGGKTVGMWDKFPIIEKACARLQSTKIENKDFDEIIAIKDSAETFFYLDPPYMETESYYESPFKKADHQRLRDTLAAVVGKWALSYNDCDEVRELYNGYFQYSFERPNNIKLVTEKGAVYKEILITNYDAEACYKIRLAQPEQLALF